MTKPPTAPDDIDLDRIEQTARDTLRFVEDKRCNVILALVARVRAAEARVADMERRNWKTACEQEVIETARVWHEWRDARETIVTANLNRLAECVVALAWENEDDDCPKHPGPCRVFEMRGHLESARARLAELEAGLHDVMRGLVSWSIGYDEAMTKLRKLVNP